MLLQSRGRVLLRCKLSLTSFQRRRKLTVLHSLRTRHCSTLRYLFGDETVE